jgi:PAS domain S-box-containing protein
MESGRAVQLEYVLGRVPVGVAILDSTNLCIRYANSYLRSLLDGPWRSRDIVGQCVHEVMPEAIAQVALPLLSRVAETGQRLNYAEIPYEGFLETRGRTYWKVTIERSPDFSAQELPTNEQNGGPALLLTIEDVTDSVRSRLHLNAIHHISSAIAGASALPEVLDRILQALQEMVGSTRCAIFLINSPIPESEAGIATYEELQRLTPETAQTARVAAQKGMHPDSQDWRPPVDERLLLGRIMREGHTLIITDTRTTPDIALPLLEDERGVYRPGSVLCVPIFDPYPAGKQRPGEWEAGPGAQAPAATRAVLGTIEVYHRRPRGFPAEEVKLLEQFAQQAGLAIQNARLFRGVDRWARAASSQAQQKENIMQAIPDGIVIYDPHWRVSDANHAARTLFGWSDDVTGLTVTQALRRSVRQTLLPDSHVPDLAADLERRALHGQVDEFRMVGADGQAYTMRCSYTPIRDERGAIFAYIVIYRDVTRETAARERVEAEVVARTAELAQRNEALQLAKAEQEMAGARLELLLERLPSGVILVNAHDRSIALINHRAIELLQGMDLPLKLHGDPRQAAKNAVGMNVEPLFRRLNAFGPSGSPVPYEERPLYRALVKGEVSEAELHVPRADDEALYLLANAAPLRSPAGTVMSAILVLHDISAIKALERARDDFFTTMAHELKTPLANIRAHLSALLAEDLQWSRQEQYEFLQTADAQVERLVGMVNHFLDASRVEAGALRLELEPILLPEMLEDLQDRLEALITSSNRRFQINQPPHLPAVLGDYELIMSVLINLLSNAFRYAPENDVVFLDVEPSLDQQSGQPVGVTLRVTDRGPGMTQEQQKELFMRFSTFAAMSRPAVDRPGQPTIERQRGTARWSPATGLGLYISRGIIQAHGSTLMVKSSPGQGASFSFTLPVFTGKREQAKITEQ